MTFIVRSLSDQLFEAIRERIISGAVDPAVPIRQEALAGELGVSKIPLREALARLEQDGLLSSHPNRGFFVRPLSAAEAEEVFDLRLKIEPHAAARASACASKADRASASRLLSAFDRECTVRGSRIGAMNRAFHMALVRPANEPVTTSVIERLHVIAERYVHRHLEDAGHDARAEREHHEMLDAWLAGASDAVEILVQRHILGTLEDLRLQLEACSQDNNGDE